MSSSLLRILELADRFPRFEEDATDYLEDRGIALVSHSRDTIIRQALHHGWDPYPSREVLQQQIAARRPAAD